MDVNGKIAALEEGKIESIGVDQFIFLAGMRVMCINMPSKSGHLEGVEGTILGYD